MKHLYTIICDDVRREDNLKLIVIGMYLGNIGVAQLPTIMPTLTVLSVFETERLGNFPFTVKVQRLETGRAICQAQGFINVNQPGVVVVPVKFGNARIDEAGAYTVVMELQGQSEILATFQVALVAQIGNSQIPKPNA